MSGEELVRLVANMLNEHARNYDLDLFVVDTDKEVFVFQKGAEHYVLTCQSARIEVNGG